MHYGADLVGYLADFFRQCFDVTVAVRTTHYGAGFVGYTIGGFSRVFWIIAFDIPATVRTYTTAQIW